jgi:hypothetical protein
MKKLSMLSLVIVIIIASCHKKAMPTITTRTTEPPPPATRGLDPIPDKEMGKTTFTNHCGRCHALPDPVQYNSKRWDGILSIMIPRARLTNQEAADVTAYIKAGSAK